MQRGPQPSQPHQGRGKKLILAAVYSVRPEWFEDETVASSGVVIEDVGEFRSGPGGLIHCAGGVETCTGKRTFLALIPAEDRALVRTYRRCTGGLGGMTWPDGGSMLDQPVKLVEAFDVIGATLERYKRRGP